MAIEITDSNFEDYLSANELLVVDFWAQWCGPCRAISPIIEELSEKYAGKAVLGKVDIDENPDICEKFCIKNIPTLLYFKNGELIDKQVGSVAKNIIENKLTTLF